MRSNEQFLFPRPNKSIFLGLQRLSLVPFLNFLLILGNHHHHILHHAPAQGLEVETQVLFVQAEDRGIRSMLVT